MSRESVQAKVKVEGRPGPIYFLTMGAWYTLDSIVQLALGRFDSNVNGLRMLRGMATRHIHGQIDAINKETGHCYTSAVPKGLLSDAEAVSRLTIYEDGVPIGPAHSSHTDIREHGGGRYSHWTGWLYFSTPDNSDPRSNGRKYTYRD